MTDWSHDKFLNIHKVPAASSAASSAESQLRGAAPLHSQSSMG
jgi:hypothetical protein